MRVNGVWYSAANIAWYLTHGEWPKGVIDHIDRNRANNKLDNLRDISQGLNCLNKRRWSKTGLPIGVYRERGRYRVSISLLDESRSLGSYDTLEEATVVAEAGRKKQWELVGRWGQVEKRDHATKRALLKELNLEALGFVPVHRKRGPKTDPRRAKAIEKARAKAIEKAPKIAERAQQRQAERVQREQLQLALDAIQAPEIDLMHLLNPRYAHRVPS